MIKTDVFWAPTSPRVDQFYVVQSSELSLYAFRRNSGDFSVEISENSPENLELLCRRDDFSFIKCADVQKTVDSGILALGLSNGRVFLTKMDQDFSCRRELTPKHARACLCLSWNPCQANFLAFGLDKHRADNSLSVWDVEYQENKATLETAQSEICGSLAWMRQNPKLLAAGLSNKCIKIYDLDDFSRPKTVLQTKICQGLCVDPFFDYRLAAYNECQVSIFDLRYVDKPLMLINEQKSILKLEFDPTKRNQLAVLSKDSTFLKILNLQQTLNEDTDMSFVENFVQPKFRDFSSSTYHLSSFAYHPMEENRLIFVRTDGQPTSARPFFHLPVEFAPDVFADAQRLLMGFPKILAQCQSEAENFEPVYCRIFFPPAVKHQEEEDLSIKMKKRAAAGYGIKSGQNESDRQVLQKSMEMCSEDESSRLVWSFMLKIQILAAEECEKWNYDVKYPGALTIVQQAKTPSNTDYRSLLGLDATGHTLMTKFYVSAERERLLNLCGWGGMAKDRFPAHNDLYLQKMLVDRQIERAAAVCLFTLRLKTAVQILTSSSASQNEEQQKSFNLIALAIAGFPGLAEKDSFGSLGNVPGSPSSTGSLWLEMCEQASGAVKSPYLKAAFQFLVCKCNGSTSYDQVLETANLPILDKIAFAAVHFTDQNLLEFLRKNLRLYTQNGDLTGLVICGLGDEFCLKLVENFLDKTSDVQTAALFLLHGYHHRSSTNQNEGAEKFRRIVDSYLRLLDAWRLWQIRAETELNFSTSGSNLTSATSTSAIHAQLVCNFCAKKIAAAPPPPSTTSAAAAAAARLVPRYSKPVSCPTCKKPLPRCSLCRLHVGGTAASFSSQGKVNKFDYWFSWCQSCKHGGHAGHIDEWFKFHQECPVAGCLCRCSNLDN